MSGGGVQQQDEDRTWASWFNDLFSTKLEIDSRKLKAMGTQSQAQQVRGNSTFYYSRGKLEQPVLAKFTSAPRYIRLTSLSVSYWCDVPKSLWLEFKDDGAFNDQLYGQVNSLVDRLVNEWYKRMLAWERVAAEADEKGDQQGVIRAQAQFEGDCVTLAKECEDVAIDTISEFFTEKVRAYAEYKRTNIKAGAKLVSTCVGAVLSVAALSTAATPLAPATLVPAIIGLTSSVAGIAKQVADLLANAEELELEIRLGCQSMVVNYKQGDRKRAAQLRELGTSFLSGVSGGYSEVFIPSLKGLTDTTGTHKQKLDGLDVELHELGINANAIVDLMVSVDKVITDNLDKFAELEKRDGAPRAASVQKKLNEAMAKFHSVNDGFLKLAGDVAKLAQRLDKGREANAEFERVLTELQSSLGTSNYATAGNLLATVTMTGVGFSSGLPSDTVEQVATYYDLSRTGVELIQEYGKDAMEKIFGE